MSDDKRTLYEIIAAALTGFITWLVKSRKRKRESKVEEIDLDEKLSERNKKIIKDLISDNEALRNENAMLKSEVQKVYVLVTEANMKLHEAQQQIDDLKRSIASMSLTQKN